MYTMPGSRAVEEAAWGDRLAKPHGSPVLRARKIVNPVPPPMQEPEPEPQSDPSPEATPFPLQLLFQELTIERMLHWLWRGWKWILLFAILGAVAGGAFGFIAKPKFMVTTEILVDPADLKVMADDVFSQNNQRETQLLDAESKLMILTSGNVLSNVVQTLRLANDPEFVGADAVGDKSLEALRALAQQVDARREDRSFIVSLRVWSQSAAKAVKISNAMVSAFQDELVKGQADGAGRAAKELFARLDTLKDEVARADQAVQRFKREHNLRSSSGELVSTLIANQVNTQLVEAQTRVIKARSRYERLSTGSMESRLDTAAIQSETMTALRTQFALAKKQFDAQSAILGARHPKIVALRPEVEALQNQIRQEQARILDAAKSELAQAESALMAQQAQASVMKTTVFEENASLVQLRELEREAQSKATVYEAFMARAKEIAERQQIDATNVRIISPPTVPKSRSYPPRTMYLMAAGMIGGFGIGCALVVVLGFAGLMRQRPSEEGIEHA
jgi:uncharacterized protein involved in exopolysaccharide biosynthesis